jgi:hypothetical protein
MSRRFRTGFKLRLPSWLRNGQGQQLWYSLGSVIDAAAQRMLDAYRARLPGWAPLDAYPYLQQDRRIRRGINEPRGTSKPRTGYIGRVIGWLDAALVRGNAFACLEQVRSYMGGDGIRVRWVDASGNWYTIDRDGTKSYKLDTGNWHWDQVPNPPHWSRFWIIIYPRYLEESDTFEPWDKPPPLDGGLYFDGSWVWGTDADPEAVDGLRKLVEEEKPAGRRQEYLIYYFYNDDGPDPDAFDPDNPAPDGTWWSWGTGEPFDQNRDPDAAYIKAGPIVTPPETT